MQGAIRLESGRRDIGARIHLSEAAVLWEPEIVAVPEERSRSSLHLGTWMLTLAAFLACVALTLPTILVPLGFKTFVVMSGSMEPTAKPGDVFVVRKVTPHEPRIGDIVTFRPLRGDHLKTHRIIGIRHVLGELHFQTKGDANASTDPDLVPARNVLGRVVYHVPSIGRAYAFAVSNKGRMILVIVPASFLIAQELWFALRRRRRPVRAKRSRGMRVATVTIIAVACSAVMGPAAARLTDTASVTPNTLTTGTLNPPTSPSATQHAALSCKVDLAWTAPATGLTPTGYDIYRKQGSGAYSLIKSVGAVTTYQDTVPIVSVLTTFTYKWQSSLQSWRSVDSTTAAVSLTCIA